MVFYNRDAKSPLGEGKQRLGRVSGPPGLETQIFIVRSSCNHIFGSSNTTSSICLRKLLPC